MQHLETEALEDWQHVFLIHLLLLDIRHTAAESVTDTVCLNSRL